MQTMGDRKEEITEAATKNKRGRPPAFSSEFYAIYSDMERRTAQNTHYVARTLFEILGIKSGEVTFFTTAKGNFRHQGIAAQIGRIYDAGLLNKDECKDLVKTVIETYDSGVSAKELERRLIVFKKTLIKGGEA